MASTMWSEENERPPDDELDRMYRRLLDELGIPESKRGRMLSQPMHMKWKLLSKHQRYVRVQTSAYGGHSKALRCVEFLDKLILAADKVSAQDVLDLRMEIKSEDGWIQTFLELGGLHKLLRFLDIAGELRDPRLRLDVLESLWVLVEGSQSICNFLVCDGHAVAAVVLCFACNPNLPRLATVVLDIAVKIAQHSKEGHELLHSAFEVYRVERHEELRYATLMECLTCEHEALDLAFKSRVLHFINVYIREAATLKERVALRSDFAYLGIMHVLNDLNRAIELFHDDEDPEGDREALDLECSEYREIADADTAEILREAPNSGAWLTDTEVLFEKIQYATQAAGAGKHFLDLLYALLVVPTDTYLAPRIWSLLGEVCQQVVTGQYATLSFAKLESLYLQRDDRFKELDKARQQVKQLERELERAESQVKEWRTKAESAPTQVLVPHAPTNIVDPKFQKYDKMRKAGLPEGAIENCMTKDGLSDDERKSFWLPNLNESSGAQQSTANAHNDALDPKFAKYSRMQKAGLPRGAIENCMRKDGLSEEDLNRFFGASAETASATSGASKTSQKAIDPAFAKYESMLKAGLPEGAIRNAMMRDNLSSEKQNEFFKLSDDSSGVPESEESTTSFEKDPKFAKYAKMRNARIPDGAIRNKMMRDGLSDEDQAMFFGEKAASSKISGPSSSRFVAPIDKKKLWEKPKVNPRKPMRALFWSKISSDYVEGSMWEQMDKEAGASEDIDINLDALEENFAQAQPEVSREEEEHKDGDRSSKARRNSFLSEKKKVELLDPKRQQNVGIAFARLRMAPEVLRQCIVELDLKRLGGGADRVNMLANILPTSEEVRAVQEYSGDRAELGNIELLFLELGTIPDLTKRIKAWSIQLRYKQQVIEAQEQVQMLLKACEEIETSSALKQTLKVILAVGNYLNGTSARGGAVGFKLDLLVKIENLKAADHKTTLLQFIVREIAFPKYPVMLKLSKDLQHTADASRVSIKTLSTNSRNLGNDLQFVENLIDKIGGEDDTSRVFKDKMQNFASSARRSQDCLQASVCKLEEQYSKLLKTYAVEEQELQVDSERFFSLFNSFLQAFTREQTSYAALHSKSNSVPGNNNYARASIH